jgi:hypothetical protein
MLAADSIPKLWPDVILFGSLMAVGCSAVLLLVFAVFMRWARKERAANRRGERGGEAK